VVANTRVLGIYFYEQNILSAKFCLLLTQPFFFISRFFAISETKLFLHKIILKYKVSTESGKIEDKIFVGPFTSPSEGGLVFENRK
jgi:hypothetical protein